MKRFIALLAICVVGMLFGAVPLKWTVDAEKVTPVAFDAYHGETLAFEATLKSYGKVIPGVSNAVLYHQTNGMGNVWWQTSASVSNGIVKASFTPAMDTGADRVAFFLGVTDAAGSNYRASGQIRFKPSPGFNPITLDVPAMQRLNLSQVEVVGAPWATMADIDAVFARKSDIPEIPDMSEFATADLIERWGMGISGEVGSLESTMHFRLDELQREVRDIPPPPDLSPYALRSELPVVPDLTGYATHGDVATNVANAAENLNDRISSLNEQLSAISDSVTSNAVAIANVSVNVDLTNYAQLSDIPDAPDLSHLATHDEVATNVAQMAEQLRVEMANITPAPDMTGYARLEDIPPAADLTNYAQLSDIPDAPDLSHLATHDEVATNVAQMAEQLRVEMANITPAPDLSGYATHGDVATNVASAVDIVSERIDAVSTSVQANVLLITANSEAIEANTRAIEAINIPEIPDLSNYVTKDEILSEQNLENYVQTNQLADATNYLCTVAAAQAMEISSKLDKAGEKISIESIGNSDMSQWNLNSDFITSDYYDSLYNYMLVDGSMVSAVSEGYVDFINNYYGDYVKFQDKFHSIEGEINSAKERIDSWDGYIGGDDVVAEVTNYFGSVDLPSLSIKQKMSPDSTHTENWLKTVWDERTRWNDFFSGKWCSLTNTVVQYLAERCWGIYDSATGDYSPEGVLQISQPMIQIADGMSYQRTVSVGGAALWVLTSNGPTAMVGDNEAGFFKIEDGSGNTLFEIVRGDKKIVSATATEARTLPGNIFRIRYNTLTSQHPILEVSRELGNNQNWVREDDASLDFATVNWTGHSGEWYAEVNTQGQRQMFARASFELGGDTYIRNHVALTTDKIMIGGTNYNVKVETHTIGGSPKQILILEM